MSEKYEKIKAMCKNLNIADGKITDEFLFTIDATDLYFFKRNIGQMDIMSGFTDGANDGGIDFVCSDGDTLYLIQGKSSSALSTEEIKNVFNKMAETVGKFEDKSADQFSEKLKQAYLEAYENLNDDKNIELVLFTTTSLNDDMRNAIAEFSESNSVNNYAISVYDQSDLNEKEIEISQNSSLIPEDSIKMYGSDAVANNVLTYGGSDKKEGIVVNVRASEIKRLYAKYNKKGLFSYNLRELIAQKSVDEGIDETIKNEKDNFWFYNNGITIGCEDFIHDGNEIKMYNFSIINGAQTSTHIGKSSLVNEKNDFAVVCKIVKGEKSINQDSDFITRISEASNSQKPIRPRDLKANATEQKILQDQCANNGKCTLAIEIKRGVHPSNYKKVDKWQRVTNEYIGQLIYACIFQHPGPARSSKNTIFTSSKIYHQIFMRKHDYNTLYDLVRIGSIYDDNKEEIVKGPDELDMDTVAVLQNGKLTIMAIITYLVKKYRGIVNDSSSSKIFKDNLSGLLITDYPDDDLEERLKDFINFIANKLKGIYQMNQTSLKLTSYSNFFKGEQAYVVILREFDNMEKSVYDKKAVNFYMELFTKHKD